MQASNLLELVENDIGLQTEHRTAEEIVATVLAELGTSYTPFGRRVIVRTDPNVLISAGGIILTNREQGFYNGPAHSKIIKSTVIAVGEQATLKVGDRVCFQRLYFARIAELQDKTFIGSIDESQMVGYIEQE